MLNKADGDEDAEYEVQYEGDKEATLVDHLIEDYRSSSLKFIGI